MTNTIKPASGYFLVLEIKEEEQKDKNGLITLQENKGYKKGKILTANCKKGDNAERFKEGDIIYFNMLKDSNNNGYISSEEGNLYIIDQYEIFAKVEK